MTSDLETRPLNEPTYVRVKRALVADLLVQRFAPGSQITIEMLTSRYQVSHMPIREALRQLQGEGILVGEAHRGFRVPQISEAYIGRIYDIRMAIEGILAQRAVEKITDTEIACLSEIHKRFRRDMADKDRSKGSQTNIEFHARFIAIAENAEAEQILDGRTFAVRAFNMSFGGYRLVDRPDVIAEHDAIMAAIVRRDAVECGKMTFQHVAKARTRLMERIRELRASNGANRDT